jgi:intein/homing endonuclease
MATLTIPYNYTPRDYQKPLFNALSNGYRKIFCVWHRRAGKDKTLINLCVKEMLKEVGNYFYIFPTYAQGRKILWNGIDKNGFKFINHIPEAIRKKTDNTEMFIELINGSTFQVIGSDRIDSIVGTNPRGIVYSEYSLQNPLVREYMSPILAENGGWEVYNTTPRGENHAFELYSTAKNLPDWFCQILTIEDTKREDGSPVVDMKVIEDLRKSGMSEDLIQQEFYCSFSASASGAYFSNQIRLATEENRFTKIPYEEKLPVCTFWDIGVGDSTAIWFAQFVGKEIRLIDYYENSGEGLTHYIKYLQSKPYIYKDHYAPHDIEVREFTSGRARIDIAKDLGIRFKIAPKLSIEDGIEAVRLIFSRCYFDDTNCKQGIRALRNYHKDFDETNQTYRTSPVHDWSSHACLKGDTIIKTTRGDIAIKDVQKNDTVILGNLKGNVTESGLTGYEPTIKLKFDDGTYLECTKNHKILTSRGVVRADGLRYNDLILSDTKIKWDSISEKMGVRKYISMNYKNLIASDSIKGRMGTSVVGIPKLGLFIDTFMNFITAKYQKIIISTTKTGTKPIIISKILNSFQHLNIVYTTPKVINGSKARRLKSICSQFKSMLLNGIDQKKVGNGIKNMVKKFGKVGRRITKYVRRAASNTKPITLIDQNSVVITAKRLIGVEESGQIVPVYNLTVAKHHAYIANNTLVSNCDSFRYMAVSYKEEYGHTIDRTPDWFKNQRSKKKGINVRNALVGF